MKTTYRFDWANGWMKARRLSRSFHTLEEATAFADGKLNSDVYLSKGLYKVVWTKISPLEEE